MKLVANRTISQKYLTNQVSITLDTVILVYLELSGYFKVDSDFMRTVALILLLLMSVQNSLFFTESKILLINKTSPCSLYLIVYLECYE